MRKEGIRRIVIRGPNWLGDAVMCEPALSQVRTLFPQAEITLLVKPGIADLLAQHPEVNRTLVYDDRGRHAGLVGKWTLAAVLRRHRFDLAILFQNAFEAALISFLAGIPRRFGYATDGRTLLLTDPVTVPPRTAQRHQVEYYWDLLKPLGGHGPAPAPRLFVTPDESALIAGRLADAGIGPSDPVIGVNPGSTYGHAKRWLPDRYAEVVNRAVTDVQGRSGARVGVAILGAKGEEPLGKAIADQIKTRTVVCSGQTTVRELMALVKRCQLFLTNDTGPMHVAAAFKVPLVAVFGPTDWQTTSPFGVDAQLVRQPVSCAPCLLRECPIDHRCMTGVTVEQVYDAVVQHLPLVAPPPAVDPAPPTPGLTSTSLAGVTVFLDRDGTLNVDTGYVKSPDDFTVLPGVGAALARLKQAGARLVVVTNQSGLGRGYFSSRDLEAIHSKLRLVLAEDGVTLDGLYFCPHHPDDHCNCRKPARGMIDRAHAELKVDLSRAYVIGDSIRDVELAKQVGARSLLVMTGPSGAEALADLMARDLPPDYVAEELSQAVDWIVAHATHRPAADLQR
ncbi:MAG: lipopolysaccharide heptosyltransferase II [Nitrospira sp.]|jgi:heptosyltransferase-2|nr:lipopolysaccharide heptosyltransferase II [Nitrospira sp.]MBK8378035.1 lipopolysaccharide heptosyltransferase II [Nitrospira sp.]MBK9996526.1 lipopolysaccharide heptosyltransferase II [Nitrospira sp.]MBP6198034.1 lipopolysaccharide heptosyltransferase II [Nitrospira sp.]MBP6204410.1 lipopolysaccharide heptosyltransferase II [Nitrospira sp.]